MKKVFVVLLSLFMTVSFTAFGDEEIGLSTGLEFGIADVSSDERMPYLMPMIIYEQPFLDDALDIYAELDYTFGFAEELEQSLYLDLMVGYNLGLSESSMLSFILQNKFDEITIHNGDLAGIFTPAIGFNQELNFGDIFAAAGLPVYYNNNEDSDTELGLNFTLGWESSFGLGLEFTVLTMISGGFKYDSLEVIARFETDPIYIEVIAEIPSDLDYGITITPLIEYAIGNFSLYTKCEFAGLGAEKISFSPALGIKYSF
jgi:hypothetical protein